MKSNRLGSGAAAALVAVWGVAGLSSDAEAGTKTGSVGPLDYSVSVDEETHAVEICLAGMGDGEVSEDAVDVEASGDGSVCVTLTPPEAPETGIEDPLTASVHLGIPTPDGLVEVDLGAFADTNAAEICVFLNVMGTEAGPQSIQVCVPPGDGDLPDLPGLPGDGLPDLPGDGLPDLPGDGLPELPTDLVDGVLGTALGTVDSVVGGLGLPPVALP